MIEFIQRIWNGKEKLWKVFWIWNFLIFNIFDVLAVLIFFVAIFPAQMYWVAQNDPSVSVSYSFTFIDMSFAILGFCFILFMLAYTVWALVALWRSAFNSSKRAYGYLARSWVIIQLCYVIIFPIIGTIYPDSIFDSEDEMILESTEYQQSGS